MRRLRTLCVVLALLIALPARAFAAPVAIDTATMAQADAELDGATVVFSGEAIGDELRAPDGQRWVNILDEGVAIGVVADPRLLESIDGYGEWSRIGTHVEVTGVYNVACPQHGGDLDVHASQIRVLAPSETVEHPIMPAKAAAALVALGITLAIAARYRTLRRRLD
jgi:hypothetical protein